MGLLTGSTSGSSDGGKAGTGSYWRRGCSPSLSTMGAKKPGDASDDAMGMLAYAYWPFVSEKPLTALTLLTVVAVGDVGCETDAGEGKPPPPPPVVKRVLPGT